jgi:hypothetical protein
MFYKVFNRGDAWCIFKEGGRRASALYPSFEDVMHRAFDLGHRKNLEVVVYQ